MIQYFVNHSAKQFIRGELVMSATRCYYEFGQERWYLPIDLNVNLNLLQAVVISSIYEVIDLNYFTSYNLQEKVFRDTGIAREKRIKRVQQYERKSKGLF